MPTTTSPSVGGVPLEVESTEVETAKLKEGRWCPQMGPRKLFMIVWNLKAFILVIWGFYGMLASTMQAGHLNEFNAYVDDNYKANVASINPAFNVTECYNKADVKDSVSKDAMPIFMPFFFINAAWMFWICISSGMLWYAPNELGFHVCWVEIRKRWHYKVCAMVSGVYTIGVAFFGVSQIVGADDEGTARALPVFLNGVLQVGLGLWALYSPLEETISYGKGAMNSPIRVSTFTEAAKALELYQDALLAALTRQKSDMTWMEVLTGASNAECELVLFDITANDHAMKKEKKALVVE